MQAGIKVDFVIEERASDFEEEMVDEAQRGESRLPLRQRQVQLCHTEDLGKELGRKGAEGRCGMR